MRVLIVTAALLGLTTSAAPRLLAQGAPTTPAAANPKLAGSWEGNYTTDGPSGVMTVTVAKETAAWKITASLGPEAPAAGEVKDITTDGNKLTWRQMVGEYDVVFKATLSADSNQLTGTIEASQGGSYVGGGSFTLTRKS